MARLPGLFAILLAACSQEPEATGQPTAAPPTHESAREQMVAAQIRGRNVRDTLVLEAMRAVPRHEFVPAGIASQAYEDRALDIGEGQEISRPYMVAILCELARIEKTDRVLEIGTGSGYGAAILAEIARQVHTIEIVPELAERARTTLRRLGYENVQVRHGDGYRGWEEAAPFDAIIVTAAPPHVPEPLKKQLRVGGRLVLPVGERHKEIRVITRTAEGYTETPIMSVKFGPMVGEVREK
ncbi:MAG: protein-L-isoaspartate(D-aspartate) O-methyltransferase [Planctomycetota bacterium]|jgi:protein-L-isoaspartate(D-aspartate) O-methyltransferase